MSTTMSRELRFTNHLAIARFAGQLIMDGVPFNYDGGGSIILLHPDNRTLPPEVLRLFNAFAADNLIVDDPPAYGCAGTVAPPRHPDSTFPTSAYEDIGL